MLTQVQVNFIPFGSYFYLATIAFNTAIYVLLYKRMRVGWILFYVFNLIAAGNDLLSLWVKNNYGTLYPTGLASDLFFLLIHIGFAVVMWKPEIAALFDVKKDEKKYTFVAAILLMVLIIIYRMARTY